MTSTGTLTDKDKLVTLEQLGRIQDENSPNELNGGKAFSEGYGKMHEKRKESLVYAKLEDFGRALFDSQVVVVVAGTGTGKTLQLPQYCLHQLRALGSKKRIDVVQPSQIATYACGERLAVELDSVNQLTYLWSGAHALPEHDETASILVTTDKIYSTLLTNDPESPVPDTAIIMIDEIHILSLDVELLLGMLHMVLQKRPDLRLVLASATCEADRLVKHFSQFSPIKIEIEGTAHHIEHIYLQPDDRRSQETRILQGLRSFFLDPLILNGDCMVFMKNLNELAPVMWSCARTLRRDHPAVFDNVEFLVLSADDLREYEDPSTSRPTEDGSGNMMRKVIFATSVAASSITLPKVRLVMITGKIEEPHFDHRTRSTEMVTRSLALSEIIQMSGRTGRTRSGTVMHFYHCNDSDKLA